MEMSGILTKICCLLSMLRKNKARVKMKKKYRERTPHFLKESAFKKTG